MFLHRLSRLALLLGTFALLVLAGCAPPPRPGQGGAPPPGGRTFTVWMLSDIQPPTRAERIRFERAIADVKAMGMRIDMAVIAGQADAQHLPDLDPASVYDGFLRDHSHAENRALRLIDNRRTELHRKLAQIRDRKRPAGIVVRRQPSLVRFLHQHGSLFRNLPQRLFIRGSDGRHDEPVLQRNRQADIDFRMYDNHILIERGVQQIIAPQRAGG